MIDPEIRDRLNVLKEWSISIGDYSPQTRAAFITAVVMQDAASQLSEQLSRIADALEEGYE